MKHLFVLFFILFGLSAQAGRSQWCDNKPDSEACYANIIPSAMSDMQRVAVALRKEPAFSGDAGRDFLMKNMDVSQSRAEVCRSNACVYDEVTSLHQFLFQEWAKSRRARGLLK